MIYTPQTKKAMRLCFEAHRDQTDKAGLPYVFHPFHVAEQMPDEKTTVVALLHDVIEDTDYTPEDLRSMGFDEEVLAALALMTHDSDVPYLEYVAKIRENEIARTVKLADLRHNSDLTRLDEVDEKALERIEKYREAVRILTDGGEDGKAGGFDREKAAALVEKYLGKLRITPPWDVKVEFVEDPAWGKSGDIKIDCDDRKAVLLLNAASPAQENVEEVVVHELMHLKMYPLDQVTESLIRNSFEDGSAASGFAYQQFFTTLEQTVEELTKCFLLEAGDDRELSFGRCTGMKSFDDLYEGLRDLE